MTLLGTIKNAVYKGGELLGMNTGLDNIIDDPRIALSADEVSRIREDKRYYQNDLTPYKWRNSYGDIVDVPVQSSNVVATASKNLASLIFNEGCTIRILNDSDANDVLQETLEANNFNENFERQLQRWIALGTGVCRPVVQNNQIKINFASADQVYPLEANSNDVNEVAIAFRSTQIENQQTIYYTLLEFHQWTAKGYQISNELYRSDDQSTVGTQVPLATLDKYANLTPKTDFTGSPIQLFAFYRNPGDNNINLGSSMGLSMIDNCKTTIDSLNRAYTELYWEMKQGQRRIIVPESFLGKENLHDMLLTQQNRFNQHPKMYDPDTMVYQVGYGLEDDTIKDVTSDIRVDEFNQLIQLYLSTFENQTGFSQGTFTATPSGIQTATEVVTNNSKTYQTRSSYLTQVEKMLKQLVRAILAEASTPELFDDGQILWSGKLDDLDIAIDFNDGVFINKEQQRQDDLQVVSAGVMPKVQFLMRNYDLDQATAEEWVEQANEENAPTPNFDNMPMNYADSGDDSEQSTDQEENTDTGADAETS